MGAEHFITSWNFVIGLAVMFVFSAVFLSIGKLFFREWPTFVDIINPWRPLILQPFLDAVMRTKWGQIRLFLWILTGVLLFWGCVPLWSLIEHLIKG